MSSSETVAAIVKRVGSSQTGDSDDSLRDVLMAHTARDLRSACKSFHVKVRSKGAKMDNKMGYVTVLINLARSKCESEEATRDQRDKPMQDSRDQHSHALTRTRKTRHCSFRLLNVLFSAQFCDRLGDMGAQPKRWELDGGSVGGRSAFWKEVAEAYVKDWPEYGRLVSSDGRFDGIDPGHMVPHGSEKLREMWKDTSAKYAAAHARANQSGSNESDFYDFCQGQLEALYTSAWLLVRPQAFNATVGSMPQECQVDTLTRGSLGSSAMSATPPNGKKRKSDVQEVVSFLENQFGSARETETKRRRIFDELEKLTATLCAAKQSGLSAALIGRLEVKVEDYVSKVEALDTQE